MGACEDVYKDLGFSDLDVQISQKNQCQHCLTEQDTDIKKNQGLNTH